MPDQKRETKADRCDYKCNDCARWYHTEKGLDHHRERIHNE